MIASLFAHIPFEQYRIVDTADFDEAHPPICQALNSARFQVLRGRITHNQLDLLPCGNLSLLQLRYGYGADVSVDPDCLDGYYLLVLPTQGQAVFYVDKRCIDVSPQGAVIVSPERRFHFTASHDYKQVLLRLNRQAIDSAWCSLTAHDHAPDIHFDPVIPLHTPGWQALLPMLQWVTRCSGLGLGRDSTETALLAQTEMLVATTLLLHQPHSMAAYLWPTPPPSVRHVVRQAQAYMLEHLDKRLPIAMIASHCNLSVRRLQAVFQDECGLSPLQWRRQQRLQAVHQTLFSNGPSCKIGETATRFGFTHLGEFSRAYKEAFGETPQETRTKQR